MRRIVGMVAAGAVALAAAGCAPGMVGFAFRPACSPMQAHAYRTTSILQTRQRVAQIQARLMPGGQYATIGATSRSLANGECR